MGLDMYFLDENDNELFYFRKHADLHGFLSDMWYANEGFSSDEPFNCQKMEITKDRLRILKEWLDTKPENNDIHYQGFFWGSSHETDWQQTREELIPLIEDKLNRGEKVFYDSWW